MFKSIETTKIHITRFKAYIVIRNRSGTEAQTPAGVVTVILVRFEHDMIATDSVFGHWCLTTTQKNNVSTWVMDDWNTTHHFGTKPYWKLLTEHSGFRLNYINCFPTEPSNAMEIHDISQTCFQITSIKLIIFTIIAIHIFQLYTGTHRQFGKWRPATGNAQVTRPDPWRPYVVSKYLCYTLRTTSAANDTC